MFDDECAATFVCYSCGAPESPLPLNLGQGSDSLGRIAATRYISVGTKVPCSTISAMVVSPISPISPI